MGLTGGVCRGARALPTCRTSCWVPAGPRALHQRSLSVLQRRVSWQLSRPLPRCSGVFPSPSRWLGSAPWSRSSCTGNRKTQEQLSEACKDWTLAPTPVLPREAPGVDTENGTQHPMWFHPFIHWLARALACSRTRSLTHSLTGLMCRTLMARS